MNNGLVVVIKRLPDRPDGTLVLHLNNRNIFSDTDPVREGVVEWNGKWPYYTRPRHSGTRSIVVGDEQRHRRFVVHVVGKSYYVQRDIKGKLSNDNMAEIIIRIVEQLGYVADYDVVRHNRGWRPLSLNLEDDHAEMMTWAEATGYEPQ